MALTKKETNHERTKGIAINKIAYRFGSTAFGLKGNCFGYFIVSYSLVYYLINYYKPTIIKFHKKSPLARAFFINDKTLY
tara:strand:+ start:347 stop:586 length:240 start_codon:yes stop_codon:yes gene_type:complete